jgi:uncharacterized membrane protein
MAPVTLPPLPGNMTVPPLFGWGDILAVLGLVVLVALAFFVFSAAGSDARGRSEWEASLEARSSRRRYPADETDEGGIPAHR